MECPDAPQAGLSDEEKEEFWTLFDNLITDISGGENWWWEEI